MPFTMFSQRPAVFDFFGILDTDSTRRQRQDKQQQEERQAREERQRLLKRARLRELLEAPLGLLITHLSSLVFLCLLVVLALELIGWFLFLGLLITILAYLLLVILQSHEVPSNSRSMLGAIASRGQRDFSRMSALRAL
ncbi:hypothetical protein DFH06DRAFT_1477378 [Mycena polygramma]|nr:hypothetical protein DFH06DRAFT_1477378 [Mycena polygramma]